MGPKIAEWFFAVDPQEDSESPVSSLYASCGPAVQAVAALPLLRSPSVKTPIEKP